MSTILVYVIYTAQVHVNNLAFYKIFNRNFFLRIIQIHVDAEYFSDLYLYYYICTKRIETQKDSQKP